ncbi:MAG: hypothetical protein AB8H03_05625 [Saprospiraceae bacterium]
MKNIFCLFILIIFSPTIFAQLPFLEKMEGVKSIQTTLATGKKETPKSTPEGINHYDQKGRLHKSVDKHGSVRTYTYEGENVIEWVQTKWDDCITAYEYHISENENTIIVKQKMHVGNHKPENPCERMMSESPPYMGADASELFKDVKRKRKFEGDYFFVTVIEYADIKTKKEFKKYNYFKTRGANMYQLRNIIVYTKNTDGTYFSAWYGVDSYGQKLIVPYQQKVNDENGFQLGWIGEKELFSEEKHKKAKKYQYEKDENKNWIKQSEIEKSSDKIMERARVIKYYGS